MERTELLRRIPQVDGVLRSPALAGAVEFFGERVTARLVRDEIERIRAAAERGTEPPGTETIAAAIAAQAQRLERARLRRVINATGVILHTNLGRAGLSDAARDAVVDASGYVALEFDLGRGRRDARAPLAPFLVSALTGAEAALIVNNNAAALLLVLAALARGREVIVSRGELIEIGGEFRLPSIMEASGAILREVGTTNRTHARDYRAALGEQTALILTVHPSNYRVVGFTASPDLGDLVAIGREAGVPVVYDIGSGLIDPDRSLPSEPDAHGALSAGADLVCFSGDKLLGGPQAGILAGRAGLIEACKRSPVARAVRADKMTLAALETTLREYALSKRSPAAEMIQMPVESIRARAAAMAARLPHATVADDESVAGGGSDPGHAISTAALTIPSDDPDGLAERLRHNDPPIIVRVENGRCVLDLRTVNEEDDASVMAALKAATA